MQAEWLMMHQGTLFAMTANQADASHISSVADEVGDKQNYYTYYELRQGVMLLSCI